MKDKRRDPEDYLTMYPELAQWVNQCVLCQKRGHRPDLPTVLTRRSETTAAARNLRKLFPDALPLDSLGRCEVCARIADK
jgi:hypothetical protein